MPDPTFVLGVFVSTYPMTTRDGDRAPISPFQDFLDQPPYNGGFETLFIAPPVSPIQPDGSGETPTADGLLMLVKVPTNLDRSATSIMIHEFAVLPYVWQVRNNMTLSERTSLRNQLATLRIHTNFADDASQLEIATRIAVALRPTFRGFPAGWFVD